MVVEKYLEYCLYKSSVHYMIQEILHDLKTEKQEALGGCAPVCTYFSRHEDHQHSSPLPPLSNYCNSARTTYPSRE